MVDMESINASVFKYLEDREASECNIAEQINPNSVDYICSVFSTLKKILNEEVFNDEYDWALSGEFLTLVLYLKENAPMNYRSLVYRLTNIDDHQGCEDLTFLIDFLYKLNGDGSFGVNHNSRTHHTEVFEVKSGTEKRVCPYEIYLDVCDQIERKMAA